MFGCLVYISNSKKHCSQAKSFPHIWTQSPDKTGWATGLPSTYNNSHSTIRFGSPTNELKYLTKNLSVNPPQKALAHSNTEDALRVLEGKTPHPSHSKHGQKLCQEMPRVHLEPSEHKHGSIIRTISTGTWWKWCILTVYTLCTRGKKNRKLLFAPPK